PRRRPRHRPGRHRRPQRPPQRPCRGAARGRHRGPRDRRALPHGRVGRPRVARGARPRAARPASPALTHQPASPKGSTVLYPVIGLVAVLVLLLLLVTSRYKVAGPNQAFIVTGRKGKAVVNPETGELTTDLSGQKVVLGGGTFVIPFVQKLATMDLSSRRISVQIRGAVSGQGIKLNLDGVAIVKVGGNADQIRLAAQRFLSQQQDIEPFTQEVLAGALRSIVGGLTVEQIIRDRAAFAQRVADESESSLTGQGLILDTFQIQDVTDDGSYLADLGRPEAARIQQEAA